MSEQIDRESVGAVKPETLTSKQSSYIQGLRTRFLLHERMIAYNAC